MLGSMWLTWVLMGLVVYADGGGICRSIATAGDLTPLNVRGPKSWGHRLSLLMLHMLMAKNTMGNQRIPYFDGYHLQNILIWSYLMVTTRIPYFDGYHLQNILIWSYLMVTTRIPWGFCRFSLHFTHSLQGPTGEIPAHLMIIIDKTGCPKTLRFPLLL